MRAFFSFLLVTLFSFSVAQTEKVQTYYENGALKETGTKVNGKKEGPWTEYLITGKFKSHCNYSGGLLHGTFAEFDMNGKFKREGYYKNGKLAGTEYHYEDGALVKKITRFSTDSNSVFKETQYDAYSGIVRAEGYRVATKRDSSWKYFDEKGNLKATESFSKGKREGVAMRYYPDGKIAERAEFKGGLLNGVRLMLTQTGDTTEYGSYTANKKNGYFISTEVVAVPDLIHEERPFIIQGTYKDGVMEGDFVIRYPSGAVAGYETYAGGKLDKRRTLFNEKGIMVYSGDYIMNKKNGTEKFFYDDGKIRKQVNYVNGKPEGKELNYFQNGKISEEAIYKDGVITKFVRYYETGKKRQEITYENGKMVSRENYDENGKRLK